MRESGWRYGGQSRRPCPAVDRADAGGWRAGPVVEGSVYRDAGLTAYVNRVGDRLLAAAGLGRAGWRFAVLDTPEANAFVLPGQRDRHHPRHARARQRRGRARRRARPRDRPRRRRSRPVAADPGRAPRRRARGRPARHGDRRRRRLRRNRPGRHAAHAPRRPGARRRPLDGGDPRRAGQGGRDHPALADRLRAATQRPRAAPRRAARGRAAPTSPRSTALSSATARRRASSAARVSSTPSFASPSTRRPGFAVTNEPGRHGRGGSRRGDAAPRQRSRPGRRPGGLHRPAWVPEIAVGVGAGGLAGLRTLRIGGLPAAQARLPLASDGSRRIADLTVVRYRGRLYRLTGLYQPGATLPRRGARPRRRELPAADRAPRRPGTRRSASASIASPPATTWRGWRARCRSGPARAPSST